MSWEFKVGQKVVCVDGEFSNQRVHPETNPRRGEIYTIRGFTSWDGGVLLAEITNEPHPYTCSDGVVRVCEVSFKHFRFRPLVTDTQSWLADILAKPPADVEKELAGSGLGLR